MPFVGDYGGKLCENVSFNCLDLLPKMWKPVEGLEYPLSSINLSLTTF